MAGGEQGFPARLAALRRQAGLSQQQLAEQLHVTRQAVSRWEQGRTQPDIATLQALCGALGCSLDRLVSGLSEEMSAQAAAESLMRPCRWLFWAKAVLAAAQGALWLWMKRPQGVVLPVVILLCDMAAYFPLGAMARTGDFTMLAGYDRAFHYDHAQLGRMVEQQNLAVQLNGLGWVLAGFLCFGLHGGWVGAAYTLCYVFGMVGALLVVAYKYRGRVLPDAEERRLSQAGDGASLVWCVVFCVQLGLCLGLAVGYQIPNNTPAALVQMGWGAIGMALGFAFFLWEQHRARAAAQKRARWRAGRAGILLLLGCVACAALQWGAAAAYAGGGV